MPWKRCRSALTSSYWYQHRPRSDEHSYCVCVCDVLVANTSHLVLFLGIIHISRLGHPPLLFLYGDARWIGRMMARPIHIHMTDGENMGPNCHLTLSPAGRVHSPLWFSRPVSDHYQLSILAERRNGIQSARVSEHDETALYSYSLAAELVSAIRLSTPVPDFLCSSNGRWGVLLALTNCGLHRRLGRLWFQ